MRGLIWGMVAVLALAGAVQAKDCSGQGSAQVLTFEDWVLVPHGNGAVELTYRLHEDKPVTRMQAHVYLEIGPDDVAADAGLELVDPAGLTPGGTATLTVTKPMAHRLAAAAPGSVTASACTNYLEYLDGSGVIID